MISVSFAHRYVTPVVLVTIRVMGAVAAQVTSLLRALMHRSEVRSLAELDDRALKDIGLSRSEVLGALAEPLHRDPSTVLVRSVAGRPVIRPRAEAGRPSSLPGSVVGLRA